jgi:hypothetical protein
MALNHEDYTVMLAKRLKKVTSEKNELSTKLNPDADSQSFVSIFEAMAKCCEREAEIYRDYAECYT